MDNKLSTITNPALAKIEEVTSKSVPAISNMELKSAALNNMRGKLAPLRSKVNEEAGRLVGKVNEAIQKYQQSLAAELAALPVNSKGKFDKPEQYDGMKSPNEIAIKVFGYSDTTAGALIAWGRERANDKAPDALKNMPLSNYAAIKAANRADVVKAIEAGEITAETPQKDLKAFAAAHPGKTKNGNARVVTEYEVYRGGEMKKAPGAPVTEEDFKSSFDKEVKLLKIGDFEFQPQEAPEKRLTGKRYVAVYPDFSALVFTLTPVYKRTKKEEEKRKDMFLKLFNMYRERHPDMSEEEAIDNFGKLMTSGAED